MHSLRYTNFLLTIIAVCLVYQCVKFGAPPSLAQAMYPQQAQQTATKPVPVQIVNSPVVRVDGQVRTQITGMASVDIAGFSCLSSAQSGFGFPVKVLNQTEAPQNSQTPQSVNVAGAVDVNLVGLRGELPVIIKNGVLPVNMGGDWIPVKVMNPSEIKTDVPQSMQVSVTNWPAK